MNHDFGVGFDLNPSYGTVAVSYPNGSIQSIAKIQGDAKYRKMMHRLSLESSQHLHQPYRHVGEIREDRPRQLYRQFRRSVGLPASEDAGTLSKMISALREAASTLIGQPISAATISIPRLAALYGEATLDAFEYISLANIEFYPFYQYYPIHSANAVYAGHSQGLCDDYTNITACYEEEQHMTETYALAISFTHISLTASLARFGPANYVEEVGTIASLRLGYDSRFDPRDDAEINGTYEYLYWERVRAVLAFPIVNSSIPRNVTKVLLWGDTSYVPKFREVFTEVVDRVVAYRQPEILDSDPIYSGARGVAEFAKRATYAQRQNEALREQPEL